MGIITQFSDAELLEIEILNRKTVIDYYLVEPPYYQSKKVGFIEIETDLEIAEPLCTANKQYGMLLFNLNTHVYNVYIKGMKRRLIVPVLDEWRLKRECKLVYKLDKFKIELL